MRALITRMRELAEDETTRACTKHGPRFSSHHEGFGVLAEEIEEAEQELHVLRGLQQSLLIAIHDEDIQRVRDTLDDIHERAIRAACESTQVAAVAEKWMTRMPTK